MYILPPSISKKIEGYRWQSFTPPAAGKSRRFRGLICHRRSHHVRMNKNTPLAHHYICPMGADGIQAAYGAVSSWAKTRFRYHLSEYKGELKEAGLWTSCTDYPGPDDDELEFEAACELYLED